MSAIEAASVRIATLADGTLRITCDIEPANAQAAFALFGSPGTPMALAALKVGHAAVVEPEKPKGGTLAKSAGIICSDAMFQDFARHKGYAPTCDGACHLIYIFCDIDSRAELDHDARAAARYRALMANFREWFAGMPL